MPTPLDRPPIVEALLDFRVQASPGDDDARFEALREALRPEYPHVSTLAELSDVPESVRALLALRGSQRRLRSEDGRRVVLVGPDRLTFSLMFHPPDTTYAEWEQLQAPAFAAWEAFERIGSPVALESLATRFVNRIDVRADRPAEALTSPPELLIPNGILTGFNDRRVGSTLDGYGVRIGRRLGAHAHAARTVALFVDVEALRNYDPNPLESPVHRDDLAHDLTRLRQLKNDLFFGSLDPSTLSRYRNAPA